MNNDRAIQRMDDNILNAYLDSQDEKSEEDEDATYDEDEQALERDAEDEQIRN